MSEKGVNRFYKDVSVLEKDNLLCVALDGRIAKTVGRHVLGAQNVMLAEAMAQEWDAQTQVVDFAAMPLSRLQGYVLDGGAIGMQEWRATMMGFARSDLLCYRSSDAELARRQGKTWQPILDRVAAQYDSSFAVTDTVIAVDQPQDILAGLESRMALENGGTVLALKILTEMLGSMVLAVAIREDYITPDDAFTASRLDDDYQAERWGQDDIMKKRQADIRAEFEDIIRFLALSQITK